MSRRAGIYTENGKIKIRKRIDGRLVRRTIGPVNTDNRRAAEAILSELENEIVVAKLQGQHWTAVEKLQKARHPKSFSEATQEYMEERTHFKMSTRLNYQSILKTYLTPQFGSLRLHEITEARVAKFQSMLANRVSEARVNTVIQLLRAILSMCERRGYIAKNPCAGVPRLQEPRTKINSLSETELEIVLANIDPYYQPLFVTLAYTGARPNELLALRWADISSRKKEINICKGLVRGHEGLPKTASSERVLPMLPPVEQALNVLRSRDVSSLTDHVFVDKKGLPIRKHLDRIWARALKKAGLSHRPSYQLRHTFASLALLKGMSPGYVAKLLGHSTLETMYRHYARWIDDASKENERRLRDAFQGAPQIDQVSQKVSLT